MNTTARRTSDITAGWHSLGLADASVVATRELLSTHDVLADVIDKRAAMCVYGDIGLGKTLAVRASLAEMAPKTTCYVATRSRPDPNGLRHELHRALALPGQPPRQRVRFDSLLRQALAQQARVLVFDDAQWLTARTLEYLHWLWVDTDVALVLIGANRCRDVLSSYRELARLVYAWKQFTAMTGQEVLQVVPAFHPVWRDASAKLLLFADAHARGNFRRWTILTSHVLSVLRRQPGTRVDEHVVRIALARCGQAG